VAKKMLSICIPVYNLCVEALVLSLDEQRKAQDLPCEILLIDDASSEAFTEKNKGLKNVVDAFIFLEKNIGRAKIRNHFLTVAKGDYLLFLDCDSTIIRVDFLQKYLSQISDNQSFVVCGGNDYPEEKPAPNYLLRWRYSHAKESRVARNEQKNKAFMSNNFLVKKALFEKINFEASLTQYGHEDTLFGIALTKNNIPIKHIDNAVMNDVLDSNEVFLQKTKQSIANLVFLLHHYAAPQDLIDEVKALRFYFLLKKIYVLPFFSTFYKIFKKNIEKKLIKGDCPLFWLDLFKLGELTTYLSAEKTPNLNILK
jgi:glycosyltransferase involved in cell wall biosynthesis